MELGKDNKHFSCFSSALVSYCGNIEAAEFLHLELFV